MEKDDKVLENELTNSNELNDILDNNTMDVITEVVQEGNSDRLKDLTYLFNQSIMKKNMLRILKFNGILDKLGDEALRRIEEEDISDDKIIGYMNAIQKVIDSSSKTANLISESPTIMVNSPTNILTINQQENPLTKESRDRILDIVERMMNDSKEEGKD